MHFAQPLILTSATLATSTAAALLNPTHDYGGGHALVVNKCPFDIYLWSIAEDRDGPYRVRHGEEYVEEFIPRHVSLRIVRDKQDYYGKDNELVLTYEKRWGHVSYDLYEAYGGHPFDGHRITLMAEGCPAVIWNDGCGPARPEESWCLDRSDLVLTLCDGQGYGALPTPPHKSPHKPPHEPPYEPPHEPPHEPPNEPPPPPPHDPPPHEPPHDPPQEPPFKTPHPPPYDPPEKPPHEPPYEPPSEPPQQPPYYPPIDPYPSPKPTRIPSYPSPGDPPPYYPPGGDPLSYPGDDV